jgi:diguanylate cyclase (GGDEF)-like protein
MATFNQASSRQRLATREDLHRWIQEQLDAPDEQKQQLLAAIDEVFDRQRELWQASKQEAVQALSSGFADELSRLQGEIVARQTTVTTVANYFEDVVARLTDKTHRDPKTRLLNFDWFMHRLESFLAIEQRVRWCVVGVVDIASFKWFNDHLGHATGDRIIERVAKLLAEQLRSRDLLAQDSLPSDLHARFGGDEFSFLVPDLPGAEKGCTIAQRFKRHVERFPWHEEDPRLADRPVRVDVGIVCLRLGPLDERRGAARHLAQQLVERADQLMYTAKSSDPDRVYAASAEVRGGVLVEIEAGRPCGERRRQPRAATEGDATPRRRPRKSEPTSE